jgi:hypothetical protein
MSPRAPRHAARRTVFVNPRFQGGVALCFAAVVCAGAVLFALSFHNYSKSALRVASIQGHYHFLTPYDIIGAALGRHVAALSAGVIAASLVVLFLIVHRIRRGAERLVETFRISMDGDLSSPANAGEIRDFADLGKKIDAARGRTLSKIREIASEAEFLRSEPLSDEEFARRWDGMKAAMRKLAP